MSKDSTNIKEVSFEDELKSKYLDYAMSVIISRAIPDARDGLKPVQRRIIYTMYELGLLPGKPFKKSATIVGNVMAKYHPHGDAAIYDTLVRLAQDFNLRYVLVEGQGNFGSIDGDSAAAMRYTEARLHKQAVEMLQDIEKNTVEMVPNFDASSKEPAYLPSKFPNLLVNGASGIAVGMATSMPPHNLREVCDAIIAYIDNPSITVKELMQYIKGPDFPTGGIVIDSGNLVKIYETGRGIINVKAKIEHETYKDRTRLIIKEIPYRVIKAKLVEEIARAVEAGKIQGVQDIRDESNREGIRIVIELNKKASPSVVENQIYKYSKALTSFSIINLVLQDREPKLLGLKDLIAIYVEHREDIIVKRLTYELNKAKERLHIVQALLKALADIDKVIETIKASKDVKAANKALQALLSIDEGQAKAILEMRLQKLTALEQDSLLNEKKELEAKIKEITSILSDRTKILEIIKKELRELKEKYGDERRTEIVHESFDLSDLDITDLIEKQQTVIMLTNSGYIKAVGLENYKAQNRGGKGILSKQNNSDETISQLVVCSNHATLLFFTNHGKAYSVKAYQIPLTSRTAKGKTIHSLLPLAEDEEVKTIIAIEDFSSLQHNFIVFVTKQGIVKKTKLSEFSSIRKTGIRALLLRENDSLVRAFLAGNEGELCLVSAQGKLVRFNSNELRPMGRASVGVKGIKLSKGDEIIDAFYSENANAKILFLSELGYGKLTSLQEFRKVHRASQGVVAFKINNKSGKLIFARPVDNAKDIIVLTSKGLTLRTNISNISEFGRYATGVRIIKLADNDKVVACSLVKEWNI